MEVLWILGGIFTVTTFVFIAIAIFFPEWVGITGQVAKRIESSHREGAELDSSSGNPKNANSGDGI